MNQIGKEITMKHKEKKVTKKIFILLLLCIATTLFSQESQKKASLLVTAGPLGILNTNKQSAPSPIQFSIGAGSQIKVLDQISLSPHASFFGNYYLWNGTEVLPAEIEHRSAYVPSIMLDIPVTWDIQSQNSIFRIGGGVSFLFRFALLANNIPSSEQDNIDSMNTWFYQDMNFLYPSIQASWDYIFSNGMTVGLGVKAYVPIASLFNGKGLHNGIATIGVRFGV